ncbi:MAG: MBL fold metallo-hydrolase [Candidatus Thorarchaeota archaeon]|jgi:L-ascorbate metabolism protein UlaG (beta-lactamase superfamily)
MTKWPEIRYLGQSGFHIKYETKGLIIDPSNKKSGNVDGDVVFCTHKHFDHTRGVGTFLERNPDAVLVGNAQVIRALEKWQDRSIEAKLGEKLGFDEFVFEYVKGQHGFFRGIDTYGLVVRSHEFSFGHGGDSLTLDGFQEQKLDLLAIPISGIVATSPKSAIEQLAKFTPPLPAIIPMHWLFRNPNSFCNLFREKFPLGNCIIPEDGELIPSI